MTDRDRLAELAQTLEGAAEWIDDLLEAQMKSRRDTEVILGHVRETRELLEKAERARGGDHVLQAARLRLVAIEDALPSLTDRDRRE